MEWRLSMMTYRLKITYNVLVKQMIGDQSNVKTTNLTKERTPYLYDVYFMFLIISLLALSFWTSEPYIIILKYLRWWLHSPFQSSFFIPSHPNAREFLTSGERAFVASKYKLWNKKITADFYVNKLEANKLFYHEICLLILQERKSQL